MALGRSRLLSWVFVGSNEKKEETPEIQPEVKEERIMLQRLVVIARLPDHLTDRTKPGAHYEKLHLQLSKQYMMDSMTGLLVVYPSCLLHVIESSRNVLVSVLRDMQQQPDSLFMEAPKVVFMAHKPERRLFPQWSFKVLDEDELPGEYKGLGDEESTERLVCSVLSSLQSLGDRIKKSETDPVSLLHEAPQLLVSQTILDNLLIRDELLSPQQHLQMYDSPIHIGMNAGRVVRSQCLMTV